MDQDAISPKRTETRGYCTRMLLRTESEEQNQSKQVFQHFIKPLRMTELTIEKRLPMDTFLSGFTKTDYCSIECGQEELSTSTRETIPSGQLC